MFESAILAAINSLSAVITRELTTKMAKASVAGVNEKLGAAAGVEEAARSVASASSNSPRLSLFIAPGYAPKLREVA